MMTSETSRPAHDVPWSNAGPGHVSSFRCAACDQAKQVGGRKLRRVGGMAQYCCAQCSARMDKERT